jgi:uncharacterized membrane protein YphA (DoxX/SURF4 family)
MTIAVSIVLALMFGVAGLTKLAGISSSEETRDHLAIPVARWRTIGFLEVAGAVGVLVGLAVEALGIAAAAGLLLTSIGAMATHLKAGDPPKLALPAAILGILSVAVIVLQAS